MTATHFIHTSLLLIALLIPPLPHRWASGLCIPARLICNVLGVGMCWQLVISVYIYGKVCILYATIVLPGKWFPHTLGQRVFYSDKLIQLLHKFALAHWSGAGANMMTWGLGDYDDVIIENGPALGRIDLSAKCRTDLGRIWISKWINSSITNKTRVLLVHKVPREGHAGARDPQRQGWATFMNLHARAALVKPAFCPRHMLERSNCPKSTRSPGVHGMFL